MIDKSLKVVTLIERLVVICVAFAALFPMYQWLAEKNMRDLQRTTEIFRALEHCAEWENNAVSESWNLAKIDFYEEICDEVNSQLADWYADVFDPGRVD